MQTSETQIPINTEQVRELSRHEMDLRAGAEYRLDGIQPLVTEGEFKVCAVISALGGENEVEKARADGENPDQWLILDLRDAPRIGRSKAFQDVLIDPSVDYMLVNNQFDMKAGTGFKGIRRGESFLVGRENTTLDERFGGFAETTSRQHFNITLSEDGQLIVQDLYSANGTRIITSQQPPELKSKDKYGQETSASDGAASADAGSVYGSEDEMIQKEQVDIELVRRAVDLRKGFPDVDASDAISVAEQLRDAEDMSSQQIRRLMAKNWHPDGQFDESQQERYQRVMKMINAFLDRKY